MREASIRRHNYVSPPLLHAVWHGQKSYFSLRSPLLGNLQAARNVGLQIAITATAVYVFIKTNQRQLNTHLNASPLSKATSE